MPNQNTTITIEWAPFTVASHVTSEQVIEAAERVEQEFLQQQQGYLKRELLKGEGDQWVDLVHWQSEQDANNAGKSFMQFSCCQDYLTLMVGMDQPGSGPKHYHQAKAW
ncbi:hypothetical protein [Marinomonas atlantica]|uniref:hypothetical protein n=1 Tax=Marinomonas atlantica TaxID=1806668 RepID=UPI0008373EE5|nr:hypothetical protein [Marinomonas atlantica]MCO4785024.1 hypothetical protein [Marinomonas atlantica]